MVRAATRTWSTLGLALLLTGCYGNETMTASTTLPASAEEGTVWATELAPGTAWQAFRLHADASRRNADWGHIFLYDIEAPEETPRALLLGVVEDGRLTHAALNVGDLSGGQGLSFSAPSADFVLILASDEASAPAKMRFGFVQEWGAPLSPAIAKLPDRAGDGARLAFYDETTADGGRMVVSHGVEALDTRVRPVGALDGIAAAGRLVLALEHELQDIGMHECVGTVGVSGVAGLREGELTVRGALDGQAFEGTERSRTAGGSRLFRVEGIARSLSIDVAFAPSVEIWPQTSLRCLSAPIDLRELGVGVDSGLAGVGASTLPATPPPAASGDHARADYLQVP